MGKSDSLLGRVTGSLTKTRTHFRQPSLCIGSLPEVHDSLRSVRFPLIECVNVSSHGTPDLALRPACYSTDLFCIALHKYINGFGSSAALTEYYVKAP